MKFDNNMEMEVTLDIVEEENYKALGFETAEQYNFPTIVNLCVLRGRCPCRCVHCPVGKTPVIHREVRFGGAQVSQFLWNKLVGEMAGFPHTTLRIHGVGEPLYWEDLPRALRFSQEQKVRTWLFTSLVTRDSTLVEQLAQYCDIVEVSINSIDEENYMETKGVDWFPLVKENLVRLRKIADLRKPRFHTRIIVSRVESKDKEYDERFVSYWKASGLVDEAFIRSYHTYNDLLTGGKSTRRKDIVPCLVHWSRFNIDCDGSAVLCFNELFKGPRAPESMVLGNVMEQPVREIWHGEKLRQVRRAQLEKDYSLVKFTGKLPCVECFSCQSMLKKDKPTSEHQVNMMGGGAGC